MILWGGEGGLKGGRPLKRCGFCLPGTLQHHAHPLSGSVITLFVAHPLPFWDAPSILSNINHLTFFWVGGIRF